MKNLFLLLLVTAIVFAPAAEAKEKKKSKKELAKEAAEDALLKPWRDKVANLESQVGQLQDEKAKMLEDINILNDENKALQKEAMMMQQQAAEVVKEPEGLYFKIQLGAYNTSITSMFDDNKTLQNEKADGKNKYVVGPFKDFQDAKNAEKDFKKLGIKGTWLVPYKDGQRVSDAEANEYLNFDIRKAK